MASLRQCRKQQRLVAKGLDEGGQDLTSQRTVAANQRLHELMDQRLPRGLRPLTLPSLPGGRGGGVRGCVAVGAWILSSRPRALRMATVAKRVSKPVATAVCNRCSLSN